LRTVSFVIPSLNEEQGITRTIGAVPVARFTALGYSVEIVVVDGGSDDRTAELASGLGARVITEMRRGYGRAIKTGFESVSGDIIITCDADGSYPVEESAELLMLFEDQGLEFLTVNRFAYLENGAMQAKHVIGNRLLALAVKVAYGIDLRDPESGMWIVRKRILPRLKLSSESWPFSHEVKLEACYYCRLKWREVGSRYAPRTGKSKLSNSWKTGLVDLVHIIAKRVRR
jgi:glycosyltransferase involved in cell wall biosynthesis